MENLSQKINESNQIDMSNWKEFKLNKLFSIGGTTTTPTTKIRGNFGEFPHVTTQTTNNGIRFYSSIYTEKGNVLVVDSAVLGWMTYQEKKFSASDHVEKLIPLFNFNKEIGLFISTVWNLIYAKKVFNYKRKASQKAIKECSIPLPKDKNNEPDWKFMEEYIKKHYKKIENTNFNKIIENTQKEKNVNLTNWKEFDLCDKNGVFDLKNSISKVHNKDIKGNDGEFPYVTRTDKNNGIARYIPKQNIEINKGKCLSLGMDAVTIYYQENDFYTGDKIKVLRNNNLNKLNSLFLISVIQKVIKQEFSWGGKGLNFKELAKLKIKLPHKDNKLDWEFMEEYVKLSYNNLKL